MDHLHHKPVAAPEKVTKTQWRLTFEATWHCLLGCGLGEVAGMVIGTALSLSDLHTIIISVILGFTGGLLLGILPLMKYGFGLKKALKIVVLGEGLSIVVMETFEVLTTFAIPGVMSAHLTDGIFWLGMLAALVMGFIAALPVNYVMIKRGVRHMH